jgi:hypothetical protein
MDKLPATRLDTTHTWEEMAAYIRACPARLNALMEFRDNGRMRIHYVTRAGTVVAQAVCTLSRGWVYGLPAGIPAGLEAAAAAGASWSE